MFSLTDYIGVESEYSFKCLKCDNIFKDHMQDGRVPRCYNCYPKQFVSNGELEIIDFIRSLDASIIIESCNRNILPSGKELDIYLPEFKVAIEHNGLYWHSELGGNKNNNYHLDKTLECENLGIKLIHIFEDEWINKTDIVKNIIKSILWKLPTVIYDTDCLIKITSDEECSEFLTKNHIQGDDCSSIKLGLYYNEKLLSVMTFEQCKENKSTVNCYQMHRLCSELNHSIVGGASKLLSHFIKTYSPSNIIFYTDRRWSNGGLYEKIGFTQTSASLPNYFYTNDYLMRHDQLNFKKSKWKNMKNNGWDRIWDCGTLKYEWTNIPKIF